MIFLFFLSGNAAAAREAELELLGIDRNNWDVGGIPPELEHMQLKIDR